MAAVAPVVARLALPTVQPLQADDVVKGARRAQRCKLMVVSACSASATAAAPLAPAVLANVRALASPAGPYKTWLLDQFGVLHDGKTAYPRAVEAVRELHGMGLRLYVLSNSSRRANTTLAKLKPFGFNPLWFTGAVTSGEITYQNLLSRHDPWFAALGRTCLHFTWADRGSVSLDGLDLEVTADPSHADFILAHGTQALGQPDGATPQPRSIAELSALLPEAAAIGIPMIVANPDVVTVSGNELAIMPGTLANMYRELGGVVRLMGKPDPVAYIECMRLAAAEHASTVMVGDSLHHDIAGAAAAGIDSIFITSGIHREDLGVAVGEFPEPAALQTLFDAHLVHQTHIAPLLAV